MRRSPAARHLAALLLFAGLSCALFGAVVDFRTTLLGGGADSLTFLWFLRWWPWAIAHGLDPLTTHLVWFPEGYNLTWATSVPTAALMGLPITLLANPVAAYDVLMLLAPVLAAWTAYLLAERLTRDWPASMVAGLLFGFSPYMAGQMHGHLNLVQVFLIPLAVLLALRRVAGELSLRGFAIRLAVLLALQFGLSVEVFASLCLFGPAAVAAFIVAGPRSARDVAALLLEIALAGILAAVLVSPYLVHMAAGRAALQGFVNLPGAYATDLLNFVVPTYLTWLSPPGAAALAARFTGNASEQGAYLGLPLIALLALYARAHWRDPAARALLLVLAGCAVATLGPFLWVAGRATPVVLPWLPMTHLPLIKGALPARFTLYLSLAAAIIAALWLAGARTRPGRRARLALTAAACAFLLPNPKALPWAPAPALPFFASGHATAALGHDANVLLLPFGALGPGMFWQAQSGMAFTQVGGNLSFIPAAMLSEPILPTLWNGDPPESFARDLLAFCARRDVTAVLAGPGTPPSLLVALDRLPWAHADDGGMGVYRVPDAALPPGEMLDMAAPSVVAALGAGWEPASLAGAWSVGREARIVAKIGPGPTPTRLTLRVSAIAPSPGGVQRVEAIVGGQVVAAQDLPDYQDTDWTIDLPPGVAGRFDLTLRILDPVRPVDRGINTDARPLGLFLKALRLD